ncbi:MAG: hypothetical protein N2Z70_06845 [Bdellovibrionaceae bacterium]|jgi:hypothetical protein|nr:hypothetical protein [Pseudobdellovibrionaceae bacterium]
MKAFRDSLRFALASLLIWGASSCQQSKTDQRGEIRPRYARGAERAPGLPQPEQSAQSYYSRATGRVFTEARYAPEFNGFMRALVSATLDPSDLGYVSPVDGVKMRGFIDLDNQGRALVGRSVLELEIRDEFVGQIQDGIKIEPILLRLPLRSGWATGGQFQLEFADSLGWIRLEGRFQNAGRTQGKISFRNSNGREGSGVDFEIDTCGFFRCQ